MQMDIMKPMIGHLAILYKMLNKLKNNNINTIEDLKKYRTIILKYNNKKALDN